MKKTLILLVVCLLLINFFNIFLPAEVCFASGNTLYVGGSGYGNYTTIQNAIDAASSGDTIKVYSGTYNENLLITKSLTLISISGSASTIINGNNANDHTIKIKGEYSSHVSNVVISGFEIRNSIADDNGFNTIDMEFVEDCQITNCVIKRGYYGIYMYYTDSVTIDDSTISYNGVEDGVIGGGGLLITTFSDNNYIQNNLIQDNVYGIEIQTSSTGNVFTGNTISDSSQYGLKITTGCNNNLIHHNTFENNGVDNAEDSASNTYDDGATGNYWDDYNGVDSDKNGIGDTPYEIPGGDNQDNYPTGKFQTSNQKPTVTTMSISPKSITYGETIYFEGSGTDPDDGDYITGYNWRSSIDGQLSTKSSFSTSSLSVGTHTIYFKVKDNAGEWSSEKTDTVVVNAAENKKPTAVISTITPNPATYGDSVYFNGYGTDEDGLVVEYQWHSSIDGVLSSSFSFTTSSLSVGTHTIYFKVKDNAGEWSDEVTETLTINEGEDTTSEENQPPVADAGGPYNGVVNIPVTFDASSSSDPDGDDDIVSYHWDFGDGTTASGKTVEHVYNKTSTYYVILTVEDSNGNTNSSSTIVTISKSSSGIENNENENSNGLPGFEFIFVIFAAILSILWKKRR